VDAPLPGAAAIRDGSGRWYESAAAAFAEFPTTADVLAGTGYERAAVLPLKDGRSTFGYLAVHGSGARPWGDGEQRRLRALSDVCAAAAARTRRYDHDHAALIRAEGLQRLSAEFSVVRYPQEVADALVAHGVTAMRAQAGAVHLLDDTGTTLRLVGSRGWPADQTARFVEFSTHDELPAASVVRDATPVFYDTPTDLVSRYPSLGEVQHAVGDGAWAIAPLIAHGVVVGTFGVTFETTHHIANADRELLLVMGTLGGEALDRARGYERVELTASALQRALLPTRVVGHPLLDIAARYDPKPGTGQVGGDWYDVLVDGDDVLLLIGDVAGHGVDAARTMGRVRFGLAALATREHDPATLLAQANRHVLTSGRDELITCAIMRVDTCTRILTWASAGHVPALLIDQHGGWYIEGPVGMPFGAASDADYSDVSFEASRDTRIVMFTDGLVERRDESLTEGFERLRQSVIEAPDLDSDSLCGFLIAAHPHQHDDTALIAIRFV